MAEPNRSSDLLDFVEASAVAAQWDAARRLMASREIAALAEDEYFRVGFSKLYRAAIEGEGLEKLLAVDLLVRIPSYVKGLRKPAARALEKSLHVAPPGLWAVNDSKGLPREAKPAEIRENVAIALRHATGDWVLDYVAEALAREDKSQRCRLELCRQLRARESSVGRWFQLISKQPWLEILPSEQSPDSRAARLRDIAAAVALTVRDGRTDVALRSEDGTTLAKLLRAIVQLRANAPPPPRLAAAAVEVARLLDEIIAAEFTLGTEADTYAPLEVLFGWWAPLPYPEELTADLAHVVRKLRSAIVLRARTGQRSDDLSSRLVQALGPGKHASQILLAIAESEKGLSAEVDDWLRGRVRDASPTARAAAALLGNVSAADFAALFAPLLLDCKEATTDLDLRRILGRVESIALSLRLAVVGDTGDIVEYRPGAHRTVDDNPPRNPRVRIVRPMVVRQRQDGAQDMIERAVVRDL